MEDLTYTICVIILYINPFIAYATLADPLPSFKLRNNQLAFTIQCHFEQWHGFRNAGFHGTKVAT